MAAEDGCRTLRQSQRSLFDVPDTRNSESGMGTGSDSDPDADPDAMGDSCNTVPGRVQDSPQPCRPRLRSGRGLYGVRKPSRSSAEYPPLPI